VAESPNIARVRDFVDAFNRRDMESALVDYDPDVELHEWPTAPGARTYIGSAELLKAVETWFEVWEWMQVEIEDIFESGDRVLVFFHQRAKGSGSEAEVEIRTFNVFTFRDGKVTRIQLFTERDPALEAAGLTPDYQEERR
jgi:ketosteroid isomerase-like protein